MATERDVHKAYWSRIGVPEESIDRHWRRHRPVPMVLAARVLLTFVAVMLLAWTAWLVYG